jgi:hypothetical protein
MAARELLRRPRSFVVPAGILVLLALLLLYPSAILDGLSDQTTGALRNTPADLIVYSEDAKSSLLRSRVDAATRTTIEGVEGVGEVSSFDVIMLGATVAHREEPVGLAVMASERALGPAVPGPGEAYVDASLRESAGVAEGDELAVGPFGTPVRVIGFTHDTNLFFQSGMIVDRATWRAALDPTSGGLTPEQSATTPPAGATDPAALPSPSVTGGPPGDTTTTAPGGTAPPGTTPPGTTPPVPPGTTPPGDATTTVPQGGPNTSLPADGATAPAAGTTATGATESAAAPAGATPVAFVQAPDGEAQAPEGDGEGGAGAGAGTTATGPEMAGGASGGAAPGTEAAPPQPADERPGSQTLLITVDAGADLGAVAAAVDEATGGSTNTITPVEAVRSLPGTETQATTFGAIRGVTLAVALVVVGLFLSFVTLERTPLYAVLKALGMSSRQLFTGVVVQVLLVTLTASVLALAATWGLTNIPLDLPTVMRPERFVETVTALAVTSVIGSVLSLRRVARVDPASAIG